MAPEFPVQCIDGFGFVVARVGGGAVRGDHSIDVLDRDMTRLAPVRAILEKPAKRFRLLG